MKNVLNIKAKASCQPQSDTQEIDTQCPWDPRFVKNNEPIRLNYKDSKKTKSPHSFFPNFVGQLRPSSDQILFSKTYQNSCSFYSRGCYYQNQSRASNSPAIRINTISFKKKNKKNKNLS